MNSMTKLMQGAVKMNIKPIRTNDDYENTLNRIDGCS